MRRARSFFVAGLKKIHHRIVEIIFVDQGIRHDYRNAHGHKFQNLGAEGFIAKIVASLGHDSQYRRSQLL